MKWQNLSNKPTKYLLQLNNAYLGLVQKEQDKSQRAFDEIRDFENKAYSITDPDTGKQLEYQHLRKDPKTRPTWNTSGANEFGRLMQGIETDDKMVREYKEPIPCSSSTRKTFH